MAKRCFQKLGVFLLSYLCLSAGGGVFVAEGALHPARKPLTLADENQEKAQAKDDDAFIADVSIVARDGISLRAWFLRPEEANGDASILLHGMGDNRLGMTSYADMLLVHGYSVLMPDSRAHGESGGNLASYGLLEADDIHRWFDWLSQNQHSRCIYGFGESMGAAQILQALQTEPRFCAVAGECPFSTFREAAYERMGQHFHTGPWLGQTVLRPLVENAFLYTRWRYGLDMRQISPEDAVASTKVPVFLIHGQNDTNFPIRHSRRILAHNQNVVLWEVPNAGHSNAIDAAPQELESRLTSWFRGHPLRNTDESFIDTQGAEHRDTLNSRP
jgi:pimeloyl-ACP methyl ester carboxylesterase